MSKKDFDNPTFLKADCEGPRQPWHDLHCKIEDAVVYDVYKNFKHCWWKVVKWHPIGLMWRKGMHWFDDVFVDLKRVSWILSADKQG